MPFVTLLLFHLTTAIGLYLVRRNPARPALGFAGWGAAIYGVALVCAWLAAAEPQAGGWLPRLRDSLLVVPAVLWVGALLGLRGVAVRGGVRSLIWAAAGLLGGATWWAVPHGLAIVPKGLAALTVALSFTVFLSLVDKTRQRPVWLLVLAAVLFFDLGVGLLFVPSLIAQNWVLAYLAVDLLVLAWAVGWMDAFEEGDDLGRDLLRVLVECSLVAGLIALQVGLLLAARGDDAQAGLWTLLFALVATANVLVIFRDGLQTTLDHLVLAGRPRVVAERAALREVSDALGRQRRQPDEEPEIEPDEMTRLTRRALSHLGDLKRLAASPLIHLALVTRKLDERAAVPTTLERTQTLRGLLIEEIARLRPEGPEGVDEFGTADAWRYYNALHFPYVVGVKPYSRRYQAGDGLSQAERAALDWFRAEVPERTLHNWQAAAAELVAQGLAERNRRIS